MAYYVVIHDPNEEGHHCFLETGDTELEPFSAESFERIEDAEAAAEDNQACTAFGYSIVEVCA